MPDNPPEPHGSLVQPRRPRGDRLSGPTPAERVRRGVQWLAFGVLWRRYGRVLRRGGGRVDLAVRPQDPRLEAYLTVVVRLPAGLAARLAPVLESLAQAHFGHHVYPPETMHLTVLDCSTFLAHGGGGELEEDLRRLAEILAPIFADTQPLPVEVRGLNVFPTTVFAQVYDPTGGLRRLRRRLRRRLLGGIRPGPVASLRDHLAFANVVRFAAPVAES